MKRLSAFCALIILLLSVTSVAQKSDAADKRVGSWFNSVRATFLERLSSLEKADLDLWESSATKSTSVPGVKRGDLGLLMPKFNPLWDSQHKFVSGAVKYANRLEQVSATAAAIQASPPRSAQEPSSRPSSESKPIRFIGTLKSLKTIIASPDGRHVLYVIISGKKQRVWIDGSEHRAFDTIGPVAFSPDSKRTVYIGTAAAKSFVVTDGAEQPVGMVGSPTTVAFTPDSKHIYYGGNRPNGWVIDEKLYKYWNEPQFSPDGSRFAFCGSDMVKQVVYVDGEERLINGFVVGSQLVFSHDSKHFAFLTIRREGVFVNMDGQESPAGGGIQPLAFPHKNVKDVILWEYLSDWIKPVMAFSPDVTVQGVDRFGSNDAAA